MNTPQAISELTAKATAQGEAKGIGDTLRKLAELVGSCDTQEEIFKGLEMFAEKRDLELKLIIKTGKYEKG